MTVAAGRVLVVEDDVDVNELVGAYAQLAGYEYDSALNGAAALEKVSSHRPDLILMDIMLPDIDGFEVCRRLNDSVSTQGIPVVILTALDREEYRQRGEQSGAVGFLTKPFDPDVLMDIIRKNANGRR